MNNKSVETRVKTSVDKLMEEFGTSDRDALDQLLEGRAEINLVDTVRENPAKKSEKLFEQLVQSQNPEERKVLVRKIKAIKDAEKKRNEHRESCSRCKDEI